MNNEKFDKLIRTIVIIGFCIMCFLLEIYIYLGTHQIVKYSNNTLSDEQLKCSNACAPYGWNSDPILTEELHTTNFKIKCVCIIREK